MLELLRCSLRSAQSNGSSRDQSRLMAAEMVTITHILMGQSNPYNIHYLPLNETGSFEHWVHQEARRG